MSNQQLAVDLLRKAADALSTTVPCATSTTGVSRPISEVNENLRNIFAPYRTGGRFPNPRQGNSKGRESMSYWTHRFCLLSSTSEDSVPTRDERKCLYDAGLGDKKINFFKDSDPAHFKAKLEESFPKLKSGGGFELLRSGISSSVFLEKIRMPQGGYTSAYLADESNLGQAVCYIRPIQRDLDLSALTDCQEAQIQNLYTDAQKEECLTCGQMIVVGLLREHVSSCKKGSHDDIEECPSPCKRKSQTTICQYACSTDNVDKPAMSQNPSQCKSQSKEMGTCPLCQLVFEVNELEHHAAVCGDITEISDNQNKNAITLKEALENVQLDDDVWNISIIRRLFLSTSTQQIKQADETEWKKQLKVNFIGEEGVDAGGLTREFFSLFFKESPVFELNSFSLNSELLEKRQYYLMGRVVSRAILSGHPGPKCLHSHIVQYIITGEEPNCNEIAIEQLQKEDIVNAVKEIDAVTEENLHDMLSRYADLLEAVGFRKNLNMQNKSEAIMAVKSHYFFYRCLPAILQFMDGLQLLGVLNIMKTFPVESSVYLKCSMLPTAGDVMDFFVPVYSKNEKEKEIEEMLVYNFHQLLRNVERGNIRSTWLNLDDGREEDVQINMGHLLQSLVGSTSLPVNIPSGIIEFDHTLKKLTTVNTCAPSITFYSTVENQDYEKFFEPFLNIIVASYGFGMS